MNLVDKEKLIGLMREWGNINNDSFSIESVADYLLENGVIVLPKFKHKQVLWLIYNESIKSLEVSSYMIRPEFNNLLQIHLHKNGFNGCCTLDDIGKTVFLTKEEAEQALKGGLSADGKGFGGC